MRPSIRATVGLAAAALVCGGAVLSADILVLRDGRRIEGQLISVQRGTIEFREDRGPQSRTIQLRRDEVQRIELTEPRVVDDRELGRGDERGLGRGLGRMEGRGRPNGMRERATWVAANQQWTDSGVDVRDGQILYFDTHGGDIQWRRGTHSTAAGDPQSTYSARRPLPDRPIGALIGRVGASSRDYFFIGDDQGGIRVRGSGRLFLGINDDNVSDNQGAFRVTIYF